MQGGVRCSLPVAAGAGSQAGQWTAALSLANTQMGTCTCVPCPIGAVGETQPVLARQFENVKLAGSNWPTVALPYPAFHAAFLCSCVHGLSGPQNHGLPRQAFTWYSPRAQRLTKQKPRRLNSNINLKMSAVTFDALVYVLDYENRKSKTQWKITSHCNSEHAFMMSFEWIAVCSKRLSVSENDSGLQKACNRHPGLGF